MHQCRVQPVVHGEAEIVLVQLDQCVDQFRTEVQILGKVICLKLKLATDNAHGKVENLNIQIQHKYLSYLQIYIKYATYLKINQKDVLNDQKQTNEAWLVWTKEPECFVDDGVFVEESRDLKNKKHVCQ